MISLEESTAQPLDMVSTSHLGETSVDQKVVLTVDDLADYLVV